MMQAVADVIKRRHIPLIHDALLGMVALGRNQGDPRIGVCGNLNLTLQRMYGDAVPGELGYRAVPTLAVGWAQALCAEDGTLWAYFVPKDYDPLTRIRVPMWDGCQLKRRMDLMAYLLKRLELLEEWYMQAQIGTAEERAVKFLNGMNRRYLEQAPLGSGRTKVL